MLYGFTGDDMRDAVQSGAVGLIRAVDRFDPDRGARLVTYAWHWIGASMKPSTAPTPTPGCVGAAFGEVPETCDDLLAGLPEELAFVLRVRRNEPLGAMPADPVILFENFAPGSVELKRAVDSIPVLDPSRLWLSAYHIGPADRLEWTSNGHGLVIGHPASVDRAFDEVRAETSHKIDRDTIIIAKSDTEVVDGTLGRAALAEGATP